MYQVVQSAQKAFTAKILMQNNTYTNQYIRLAARDINKPYTVYSERTVTLEPLKQREITMTFPVAPDYMEIYTYNINSWKGKERYINPKAIDQTYSAELTQTLKNIKDCDVWMDSDVAEFSKFAEQFSINAGLLSYGDYRSNSGKFLVRYMPYITYVEDYTYKIKKSTTPSRIGHKTGKIEVSKEHFINYSIPKRFIILLHEFMHKYGNQKYLGRDIANENGADFLALYVYLGKGYPRIDAKDVFLKIFYNNPTEDNEKRKNMILRFIEDFDSGKINNLINCKTK
jgi:hypothetical protein